MRSGVALLLMLAAGCTQPPNLAVQSQLQDALVTLAECIDEDIVRRDDGVTAARTIARTVVRGCVKRHGDPLDALTDGQVADFLTGFEKGLVDQATEDIIAQRASKLA